MFHVKRFQSNLTLDFRGHLRRQSPAGRPGFVGVINQVGWCNRNYSGCSQIVPACFIAGNTCAPLWLQKMD